MSVSPPRLMQPVEHPVVGSVRPPGSKSITNRALVVAALAEGDSLLQGVLDSRDTQVMIDSLQKLGLRVRHDTVERTVEISGTAGRIPTAQATLWLENSGTSIRFLTAMCALGQGTFQLDGNSRMRQRPIQDLIDALASLGVKAHCPEGTGCPPVVVESQGIAGGHAPIAANLSSQFVSGLLMAAPYAREPIDLEIVGPMVSEPYVDMTLGVMARFGVTVDTSVPSRYRVPQQAYRAQQYEIEPDASAASYFFAAAAITGGSVTVTGLSFTSLQGDIRFVEALEQMGCRVDWNQDSVTVHGGPLHGIDIDMGAYSDTAQTLAAVAVFADGPTRIRNVGHIRHKETDRIYAVATELRRLGLSADESEDGLVIHPGPVQPAIINTYDDHRMAMSFALVGLRHPGIQIADPDCTAKTYPEFFNDLDRLCGRSS